MSELGRLLVVTPSTAEPLTKADAKAWLKIEEAEVTDDGLVDRLIATARQRYEQHTQRALLKQTFDYYLDCYPTERAIRLPRAPLVSVASIKSYTDLDATDTGGTAMSSSQYYLDVASMPGRVVPFGVYTFPAATRVVNAIIIRFVAGYSSQTTGVPEQAKTTLLKMVARAYEFRGDQSQAEIDALMDEVVLDELALPEWG
jgi:uncharacterized phiE125 gp8 family phage protein